MDTPAYEESTNSQRDTSPRSLAADFSSPWRDLFGHVDKRVSEYTDSQFAKHSEDISSIQSRSAKIKHEIPVERVVIIYCCILILSGVICSRIYTSSFIYLSIYGLMALLIQGFFGFTIESKFLQHFLLIRPESEIFREQILYLVCESATRGIL